MRTIDRASAVLDATLIQAHGDTFTITGIERVQQGMREMILRRPGLSIRLI